MAQFLQEPSKSGAVGIIANGVQVCEFATRFVAIFEHLTESAWGDGRPRVTSTLLTFAEEGLVKLCLHDRAAGRMMWCSGSTWLKALEALEARLEDGSGEWRKDKMSRRT